jgi:hypothetical protein
MEDVDLLALNEVLEDLELDTNVLSSLTFLTEYLSDPNNRASFFNNPNFLIHIRRISDETDADTDEKKEILKQIVNIYYLCIDYDKCYLAIVFSKNPINHFLSKCLKLEEEKTVIILHSLLFKILKGADCRCLANNIRVQILDATWKTILESSSLSQAYLIRQIKEKVKVFHLYIYI